MKVAIIKRVSLFQIVIIGELEDAFMLMKMDVILKIPHTKLLTRYAWEMSSKPLVLWILLLKVGI